MRHIVGSRIIAITCGLAILLTACLPSLPAQAPQDGQQYRVEIGQTVSHEMADGARFDMSVKSAEQADSCPTRVDPDTRLSGNFQVLDVVATFDGAAAEDVAVSLAPDRFELVDEDGTRVGGFNEVTTWECFEDKVLLPMLALPGQAYSGLVVLEVAPRAVPTSIIFLLDDSIRFQWALR